MNAEQVLLNQIASGVVSFQRGLAWFKRKPLAEQKDVLQNLYIMSVEAGGEFNEQAFTDIEKELGREKTAVGRCIRRRELWKIPLLPAQHYEDAFEILLSFFRNADVIRKEHRCRGQCSHWWHEDLSQPRYRILTAELLGSESHY